MENDRHYDVIIIGGSYAGLSAALALGRALRKVLVIDSGKPCNRQTPHSHNFLTHDGETPARISALARAQVEKYETISFYEGLAVHGDKIPGGFKVQTRDREVFTSKRLLFATGLKDLMPGVEGFAECWGISILHCPYCHGYEMKNEKTGIMADGDAAFHYARLISNWSKNLVILSNGIASFNEEQMKQFRKHKISIIDKEINHIEHRHGHVEGVIFTDGSATTLKAIYSKPDFIQHCSIPEKLGCQLSEEGLIEVDMFRQTTVKGVYACGDNSGFRSVSVAVSSGTMAGASLNNDLIAEEF